MVRYGQEAQQLSNRSACTTSCPCQETDCRPSQTIAWLFVSTRPLGPFILLLKAGLAGISVDEQYIVSQTASSTHTSSSTLANFYTRIN